MKDIIEEKEYLLNKWKIENRHNESIERYDWNGTEEICITEAQAYDILAEEQAQHNSYENGLLFH